MKIRSVLMGSLVVLMGMAAGLLLSLLFWPSPPEPSKAPQGMVSREVPPEPVASWQPAPEITTQLSGAEAPKPEPVAEVSSAPLPWPVPEDKKTETQELQQKELESGFAQKPGASKQAASTKEIGTKAASARSRRDSKTTGSGLEKESFSFTLHVESFKSAEAAERRVNVLRGQGLDAFSRAVEVPGKGLFHRVFVGRFQDRASASKFLERLKAENKLQGGRVLSRGEMGG